MFENMLFNNEVLLKPLPNEEIRKLFIDFKNGDEKAKEKIILHNLRLVFFVANKIKTNAYDMDEVVLTGIYGLMKAINSFDLSKNVRFSTYANVYIRNEIISYYRKEKRYYEILSLDKEISHIHKNITLGSLIIDNYDFVEDFEHQELIQMLNTILESLNENEKQIIKLYFGFFDRRYEQKEIAKMLSVSQAYISKTINQVLPKLKIILKSKTK